MKHYNTTQNVNVFPPSLCRLRVVNLVAILGRTVVRLRLSGSKLAQRVQSVFGHLHKQKIQLSARETVVASSLETYTLTTEVLIDVT